MEKLAPCSHLYLSGYNGLMEPLSQIRLQRYLPPAVWEQIQKLSQLAAELQTPLYLVGGLVRDFLLGFPSTDLDVVIASKQYDGLDFAAEVVKRQGGELVTHERFRTATWYPDQADYFVDFITARRETYAAPGRLPDVIPSTLEDDLARRDFTINTLAIRLDGEHLGRLIDQHEGADDLLAQVIRVLHGRSFQDDGTRMWRAVRYEQRLGFEMAPQTAVYLQRDLDYLRTISGDRIRHELELVLQERRRGLMLQRLDVLGILAYIQPELRWYAHLAAVWERLPADTDWTIYLTLWLLAQPAAVTAEVLAFLNFPNQVQSLVEKTVALVELVQAAGWSVLTRPSVIERALRPFAKEDAVLEAAIIACPAQAPLLKQYRDEWRGVKTAVDGHTLREQGVPPGPIYREILDEVLGAKLDGEVETEGEELVLVGEIVGRVGSKK